MSLLSWYFCIQTAVSEDFHICNKTMTKGLIVVVICETPQVSCLPWKWLFYLKKVMATCWASIISCKMLTISVRMWTVPIGRKWFLKIIQFSIYNFNKWEFTIIKENSFFLEEICLYSIFIFILEIHWAYRKWNSYSKITSCKTRLVRIRI